MTQLSRRQALSLLGATALGACAPAIPQAQLGEDPFEGGIGGTGIVGIMIGAGSVLVNGLRVEIPSTARVFSAGNRISDSVLSKGVTLNIVARARADRLEARRIDVDAPLVGVLERQGTGFSVHGTPLAIAPGTPGVQLVGQRVAAHGLWQPDGSVEASLIIPQTDGTDRIAGVLTGSARTGWRIGQTALLPPRGPLLLSGQYVVATGRATGAKFIADRIVQGRFRAGTELQQLSVEGTLEPVREAPGFRLSGLGHSFERRLDLSPFTGTRAVYFGPYTGLFGARRAVILPDTAAQRRTLLRPADDSNFAAALGGPNARRITEG